VNDDKPIPKSSPIVEALLKEESIETEDVMALVGFVGPGRNGDVRLYPDIDFQRWMDIAPDEIVDHSPLTAFNPGRLDRTVVWVRREAMMSPVFKPESLKNFKDDFAGSWMSTWPLIPQTRLLAAQLLNLVPDLEYDAGR
jgi:hypothetical protein